MQLIGINGAVCRVRPATGVKLREMLLVGNKRLIGSHRDRRG